MPFLAPPASPPESGVASQFPTPHDLFVAGAWAFGFWCDPDADEVSVTLSNEGGGTAAYRHPPAPRPGGWAYPAPRDEAGAGQLLREMYDPVRRVMPEVRALCVVVRKGDAAVGVGVCRDGRPPLVVRGPAASALLSPPSSPP